LIERTFPVAPSNREGLGDYRELIELDQGQAEEVLRSADQSDANPSDVSRFHGAGRENIRRKFVDVGDLFQMNVKGTEFHQLHFSLQRASNAI
jgi:hypothetical protein